MLLLPCRHGVPARPQPDEHFFSRPLDPSVCKKLGGFRGHVREIESSPGSYSTLSARASLAEVLCKRTQQKPSSTGTCSAVQCECAESNVVCCCVCRQVSETSVRLCHETGVCLPFPSHGKATYQQKKCRRTDGLFSPSAAGAAQCLSVHSPTASLAICTSNAASGSVPPAEAKMAAAPAT